MRECRRDRLGNKNLGPTVGYVNPQIMKIHVEKSKLDDLLKKFAQWREQYGQLVQQHDLKLQHKRDKQAMLNSEQVSVKHSVFLERFVWRVHEKISINRFHFR